METKVLHLSRRLGELLLANGGHVTAAESCTGGGIAHAITAIPGSSAWFEYGFVTYANRAKSTLVGVDSEQISLYGAVSEPVVIQMCRGALVAAEASVAVAVSGIAGPEGGTEGKPVGTVWFAWAQADGPIKTACQLFAGDRLAVRQQAVIYALEGLIEVVSAKAA